MFLRSLLLLFSLSQAYAQCPSTSLEHDYDADLVVASGWNAHLATNDLGQPRGMVLDSEGNLLVVDRGVGVVGFRIVDREGGGACLVDKKFIIEDDDFNHGIALSEDGRTLYVSSRDKVYAYAYDAVARTKNSTGTNIITNMSNDGHSTRTLTIYSGTLLVSAGSEGNLDEDATDPNSGRSVIKSFTLEEANSRDEPYDYRTEGRLLGWGLRNSVGVTVDSETGGIWTVENSVDNLRRGGEEVWQDNPGEELNFLGWWNETVEESDYTGPNYGYPGCVAVWDVSSLPDNNGINVGDQIVVEQIDTPNATTDGDCKDTEKFTPPRLTFQAHQAPLDLAFDYFPSTESSNSSTGGDGGLWITFHGSWNRDVPIGYKVSKIPFDRGTGEPVSNPTDQKNYEDILWNRDTMRCAGNDCFRPVGVVVDSKGRVWVSADDSGEIMVLWSQNENERGGSTDGNGNPADGGDGGNGGDGDGDNAATRMRSLDWRTGVLGLFAVLMGMMLL